MLAAVRTALARWAPRHQLPICTLQDLARATQLGEQARQLLPEGSLFWRSVISSSLGSVYLRSGDVPGAAREFGDAARLGIRGGNLLAALAALERKGRLLTPLGQPRAADDAAGGRSRSLAGRRPAPPGAGGCGCRTALG